MEDNNRFMTPGHTETSPVAPPASLTQVSIRRPTAKPSAPATPSGSTTEPDRGQVHRLFDDAPVIEMHPAAAPRTTTPDPAPEADVVGPGVAPSAIIDLWEHLALNRLRPDLSDVDPVTIARQWPNSLMLRVTERGRRPGLEVAHMFAPSTEAPTSAIPIDAMTVDWIVSLGREVVITGGPVHETDAVPTGNGPIRCGVIALPFGPETGVDHVLCHLYRIDPRMVEGSVTPGRSLPPRDRTGIRRLFGR